MRFSPAGRAIAMGWAIASLAACGDDVDQRSESNYCTQVGNHLAELNAPTIATDDDIDSVLDAWRTVARSAPLAVEAEWNTMVDNLQTAATVDPADPVSMQKVADTARASEPAANRVISYTLEKCGATIGNVAPVVTTTSANAPSTTSG